MNWIHALTGRGSLTAVVATVSTTVTVLIAGLVVTTWWVTRDLATRSDEVSKAVTEVGDHAVDLAMKGEAMRLHVVQVQQFLTDISATRAADGLDGGFAEAAVHAQAFATLLAALRDHYRSEANAATVARLANLDAAFVAFNQAGQEMAKAYIEGGPAKGNVLMAPFDAAAAALSKELDPFIADQLTALEEGLATAERAAGDVTSGVVQVRLFGLAALLIIGAAAFLARRGMQRRVLAPVGELVAAVRRVAEGDLQATVAAGPADEIGDLATAFNQMTVALRTSTEAVALKVALDQASSNIMVCDRSLRITYLNERARTHFQKIEQELRKVIPAFRVDALIGQQIDAFHRDPARLHALLDDPAKLPHTARVVLGPFIFELVASAVVTGDGSYTATVVEWREITEGVRLEHETRRILEGVIGGRLDLRIDDTVFTSVEYRAQVERLNAVLDSIAEPLFAIRAAAAKVEGAVSAVAENQAAIAGASERQVHALEETSTVVAQIAATVEQNAGHARQARELTAATLKVAEEGRAVVTDAVAAMAAIEESSGRIREIIEVINEIAFQTNLLSLNAAVEAARAGEQGRGFAVVAAEVRNLARRSAHAADEIKQLIHDSVAKVGNGTELVNSSGERLAGILASVTEASTVVAEIASASEEQAHGIQEVNRVVGGMRAVNQQNADLIKTTAYGIGSLTGLAQGMDRQVARFRFPGDLATTAAAVVPAATREGGAPTTTRTANCWEFKKCGREAGGAKAAQLGICPAYPDHGHDCAYVTGTLCGGEVQGSFAAKQANCLKCDFFKSDSFEKA